MICLRIYTSDKEIKALCAKHLLGSIDGTIAIIVDSSERQQHLINDIDTAFQMLGLYDVDCKVMRSSGLIAIHNKTVKFVLPSQINCGLRGTSLNDAVFTSIDQLMRVDMHSLIPCIIRK